MTDEQLVQARQEELLAAFEAWGHVVEAAKRGEATGEEVLAAARRLGRALGHAFGVGEH